MAINTDADLAAYQGGADTSLVAAATGITMNDADIQLVGGLLPRAYIRSVTLESSKTVDDLVVTAEFLIKDKLDDDMSLQWYGNKDLLKALKFSVYFCTHEATSNILTEEGFMRREVMSGRSVAMGHLSPDKQKLINKHTKKVQLSGEFFKKTKNIANSAHSYVDERGNIIFDISIRRTVKFSAPAPSYLTCKILPYMDMKELADDIPTSMSAITGQLHSDVILKMGDIIATSRFFLTEDGAVWPGPYHRKNDGKYYAGAYPVDGEAPALLTIQDLPNTKVQDFRRIQELESIKIDFGPAEMIGFADKQLDLRVKENEENVNYFSKMYTSRTSEGAANFFFAFDFKKMLQHNSKHNALYERGGLKLVDQMIKASRIHDFRITRRRVRPEAGVNSLASNQTGQVPFDKNQAPVEIVASTQAKGHSQLSSKKNPGLGSVRELTIGLEDDTKKNMFRFFTGTDESMSSLTDGLYQYSVEMSIVDGSQEILKQTAASLQKAVDMYRKYYRLATSPDPQDPSKMNFNQETRRFTQSFALQLGPASPYSNAVVEYLRQLQLLTGASDSSIKAQPFLWAISSPQTGSPQGISNVLKLMENLLAKVSVMVGTTTKFGKNKKSHAPKRTFEARKDFSETIDSNTPNDYGLDYLAFGDIFSSAEVSGVGQVSIEDYFARANKETLKYFKSTNVSILGTGAPKDDLNNSLLGFLAPAKLNIPSSDPIELLNFDKPDSYDLDDYDLAFSTVMAASHGKNSPFILPLTLAPAISPSKLMSAQPALNMPSATPEQVKTYYNFGEILQSMGIKVSLQKNDLTQDTVTQDEDVAGSESDSSVISDKPESGTKLNYLAGSLFAPVVKGKSFKKFMSATEKELGAPKTIQFFDPMNPKGFVKNFNAMEIKQLPNQIKSLMIKDKKVVVKSWLSNKADIMTNAQLYSKLCFDYLMLKRVEYLAGFETMQSGESSMLFPVWKPLSVAVIDDVEVQGTIFCRMVDYRNDTFGLRPPGLKVPVYDEYFTLYLGPEPNINFAVDSLAIQQVAAEINQISANFGPAFSPEFGTSF